MVVEEAKQKRRERTVLGAEGVKMQPQRYKALEWRSVNKAVDFRSTKRIPLSKLLTRGGKEGCSGRDTAGAWTPNDAHVLRSSASLLQSTSKMRPRHRSDAGSASKRHPTELHEAAPREAKGSPHQLRGPLPERASSTAPAISEESAVVAASLALEQYILEVKEAFRQGRKKYMAAKRMQDRQGAFDELTEMLGPPIEARPGWGDWREDAVEGLQAKICDVVEAVQQWRWALVQHQDLRGKEPRAPAAKAPCVPFHWNGKDILHEICACTDFLGRSAELREWYGPDFSFTTNPFMRAVPLLERPPTPRNDLRRVLVDGEYILQVCEVSGDELRGMTFDTSAPRSVTSSGRRGCESRQRWMPPPSGSGIFRPGGRTASMALQVRARKFPPLPGREEWRRREETAKHDEQVPKARSGSLGLSCPAEKLIRLCPNQIQHEQLELARKQQLLEAFKTRRRRERRAARAQTLKTKGLRGLQTEPSGRPRRYRELARATDRVATDAAQIPTTCQASQQSA
eukprot:scaffold1378_cov257-Pinguiococcus_pyrenoidosus.AAC.7